VIAGPTAVFSSAIAVVVALRFAGVGFDDSACARLPIVDSAALTWLASAENAELASSFSAVAAFSVLVRSAETWPPVLALILMVLSFVSAVRSAMTCAHETEDVAAGLAVAGPDELTEEPASLPVALAPHAASNAMAASPAIAGSARRGAGSGLCS
jgi:hypothetical protein